MTCLSLRILTFSLLLMATEQSLISSITDGLVTVVNTTTNGIANAVNTTVNTVINTANNTVGSNCAFGVKTVSFIIFTRDLPNGKDVTIEDQSLPLLYGKPTKILIHGFISEANNSNYYALAEAWLTRDNINIVSVDWKQGACTGGLTIFDLIEYPNAVSNVPVVGEYVANFTKKMMREYGITLDDIVVVGHSLGGHVAGYSGKAAQAMGLGMYSQIIGLDPAGPGFEGSGCAQRLCETDAKFVSAVHTSILGMSDPVGEVDFYFNGGYLQPGCILATCSHTRAVVYLVQVVRYFPNCTFLGSQWNKYTGSQESYSDCSAKSCSIVGEIAAYLPARGTLYVDVERSEPYCRHNSLTFLGL